MKLRKYEWLQIIAMAIGVIAIFAALMADHDVVVWDDEPEEEEIVDWS
jgi:steroid 5-alpha reductase family enzyme